MSTYESNVACEFDAAQKDLSSNLAVKMSCVGSRPMLLGVLPTRVGVIVLGVLAAVVVPALGG